MTATIYVTAGATEFVTATITETSGKDISADPVALSLTLTGDEPGDWIVPELVSADVNTVVVRCLVGGTFAPGRYFLWARIGDSPEVVIRRLAATVSVG